MRNILNPPEPESNEMIRLNGAMPEQMARRIQAVFALLNGAPASQVSLDDGICRRDLYKFRRRALDALEQALQDQPRGSRQQLHAIAPDQADAVRRLCERYPTWSSYQIRRRLSAVALNHSTSASSLGIASGSQARTPTLKGHPP